MRRAELSRTAFVTALRAAAAGIALLGLAGCGEAQSVIRVLPSEQRQTISGWEVTPRFWEFDKGGDRYDAGWLDRRDDIVRGLVEEAGVNRIRIEVRSGVENPVDYWSKFTRREISYQDVKRHFYEKINDNADPNVADPRGFQWSSFDYYVESFVLPMREALRQRGQKLIVNLCYVDFRWTDLKGDLSHAKHPDEYAELISLAVDRLADRWDIHPDFVEIILEPDNSDDWSGDAIGRALVELKQKLAANAPQVKFIAPSTAHAGNAAAYFDKLASVPGAAGLVSVLSYHRYDGDGANRALPGIVARAAKANIDMAMLEYVDASAETLFSDLTRGRATAWQLYGAADHADAVEGAKPGYLLAATSSAAPSSLTPRTAQMALVFRNVHAGAVRLETKLEAGDRGAIAAAFRNPDDSIVLAAYASGGQTLTFVGVPAGTYRISYATSSEDVRDAGAASPDAAGSLVVRAPARGVLLLRSAPSGEGR